MASGRKIFSDRPSQKVIPKRRYEAHFVSKLTDVDGENSETDTWLDFAKDCGYLEGKMQICGQNARLHAKKSRIIHSEALTSDL
jgi:four helix bundle protein